MLGLCCRSNFSFVSPNSYVGRCVCIANTEYIYNKVKTHNILRGLTTAYVHRAVPRLQGFSLI